MRCTVLNSFEKTIENWGNNVIESAETASKTVIREIVNDVKETYHVTGAFDTGLLAGSVTAVDKSKPNNIGNKKRIYYKNNTDKSEAVAIAQEVSSQAKAQTEATLSTFKLGDTVDIGTAVEYAPQVEYGGEFSLIGQVLPARPVWQMVKSGLEKYVGVLKNAFD